MKNTRTLCRLRTSSFSGTAVLRLRVTKLRQVALSRQKFHGPVAQLPRRSIVAYAGEQVVSQRSCRFAHASTCPTRAACCLAQVSTLRQRLAALEQELKTSDKEAFLNNIAAEKAAELAALPLHEPSEEVLPAKQKGKSNGKVSSKGRKLQKQPSKPKMDELADAERQPKLFEPADGPPPRVGTEELRAEGTGHEVLLQVNNF